MKDCCVVQPHGGAFSTSCAGVAARMLEYLQHCVVRAPSAPFENGARGEDASEMTQADPS